MDTRTKIVSTEEAGRLAASGAIVVSGFFDPMLASHAERLSQIKRYGVPLLVLVATPEDPILTDRARAELVASLTVVDYVAENCGIPAQFRLEQEDTDRLARLIGHVHARQNAAS